MDANCKAALAEARGIVSDALQTANAVRAANVGTPAFFAMADIAGKLEGAVAALDRISGAGGLDG